MFCITETHLVEKEDLEIEGYEIYRNDRDSDGGGVLIGIQKQLDNLVTIVEEKKDTVETLWMVLDNDQVAIRVGVIYAPQESRTTLEKYEEMYQSIGNQILLAKQNNQKLMLVGDFNCKIGQTIKGNNEEVTKSGKIFNEMITKNKLMVLNSMEDCKGVWTREEGGTKSVLDYIVIDKEDERAVDNIMVDEDKEFAPVAGDTSVTSDHNALIAEVNWLIESEGVKETPRTTITKKGYKQIEAGIKQRNLIDIFKKDEPVQELYQEFKDEVNKLVKENQIKVKKNNKRKTIRLLIKAKKNIKGNMRKDWAKLSKEEKHVLVARMKILDEEIKKEGQKQFQQKLEKVVNRLNEEME